MNFRFFKLIKINLVIYLTVASAIICWIGCNKGFDRVLDDRDFVDTTSSTGKQPRVLFIVVDGARGQSVRDLRSPNLSALLENAIYSWNDVADTSELDLTTWADLLTGVRKDKHNVTTNDLTTSDTSRYPVFFKYIKEYLPKLKVASFTSSSELSSLISASNIETNETFNGDDDATHNAALEAIKDSSGFVFVEFNEVDQAGNSFGYDLSVPEYKNKLLEVDGYIGDLVNALKERENYKRESWLVVVASNRGGEFTIPESENDHTILSNPVANNFIIFHNEGFRNFPIERPFTGNRFTGKAIEVYGQPEAGPDYVNAIADIPDQTFDFGEKGEFTISYKIKTFPGPNGDYKFYYPGIFSKRSTFSNGANGWSFGLSSTQWVFQVGTVEIGRDAAVGRKFESGLWHELTAVGEMRGNERFIKVYTDGEFDDEVNITQFGNFDSDDPITIGSIPPENAPPGDFQMVDIKIWGTVLSEDRIKEICCEVDIVNEDSPYFDFLLGYWPALEGEGNVIKDHSDFNHDFIINGDYDWLDFNDLLCPTSSTDLAGQMPQSIDVARQVLNWLRIPVLPDWGLDGKIWLDN